MKIFTADQIREWDRFTIKNEPISSIDLMERASIRCSEWILQHISPLSSFIIFCGTGNNGGDGLAIAFHLKKAGRTVLTYILASEGLTSSDNKTNTARLTEATEVPVLLHRADDFPEVAPDDVIIDALYGTGLNRPLKGISSALVEYINGHSNKKISIDIPSGLYADSSSSGNIVVKATYTLSFQQPKLSFFLPENENFTGDVECLDIGLSADYYSQTETPYSLTEMSATGSSPPPLAGQGWNSRNSR